MKNHQNTIANGLRIPVNFLILLVAVIGIELKVNLDVSI